MPKKKYVVSLTTEERLELTKITNTGKAAAYKVNHSRILLKSDINQEGGGWCDSRICEAINISQSTVERVRKRFVEQGLEAALGRKTPTGHKKRRLDGEQEAHLIALGCSSPPEGYSRWSLRMLADKMVELEYVESIGYETIRQTLKKTNLSLGRASHG